MPGEALRQGPGMEEEGVVDQQQAECGQVRCWFVRQKWRMPLVSPSGRGARRGMKFKYEFVLLTGRNWSRRLGGDHRVSTYDWCIPMQSENWVSVLNI